MTISPSGLSFAPRQSFGGCEIINASWRRCFTDYKLSPTERDCVDIVPHQHLKVLQSGMADLLSNSTSIIDRVRKIARDVDRIVLIANSDGIVVSSHADSPVSQEILREGFALGSILHEQRVGTNGIGTCIAARRPITVHAGTHFNERFRKYTCAAAPIFGPDGNVVAAIDISGRLTHESSEGSFAQHFIREAAHTISLSLFRQKHKSHCIVGLSTTDEAMPLSTPALVALDEAGTILGATPDGFALLGIADLSALGGRTLADICKGKFSGFQPISDHCHRLQSEDGKVAYATAFNLRGSPGKAEPRPHPREAEVNVVSGLESIAGGDPAMIDIIGCCRRLIESNVPILLLGETGVGKDTLARALHAESSRAAKPYVALNCASIPETLLASELFGYTPGTFTGGCKGGRVGKIAASNGGILFLDEIGDMPLDLQAHLLQVLEDRTVTPLGSTTPTPVDLKIICATHRDLAEMVKLGQFRRDLYYRIRGAQFVVPALRERTDLKEFVAAIISNEASTARVPVCIGAAVLELFSLYTWPGNVRELRNAIRYALSMHTEGNEVQILDLPDYLVEFWRGRTSERAERLVLAGDCLPSLSNSQSAASLKDASVVAERTHIANALATHGWNVTAAAAQLGISRSTLHRKMRQYAVQAPKDFSPA